MHDAFQIMHQSNVQLVVGRMESSKLLSLLVHYIHSKTTKQLLLYDDT
jgi:hypothetical protein